MDKQKDITQKIQNIYNSINEDIKTQLNLYNVYDINDLINFFPRSYIDCRETTYFKDIMCDDKLILTIGTIVNVVSKSLYNSKIECTTATCAQEGAMFYIEWYNNKYVKNSLKLGKQYKFYGKPYYENNKHKLKNPIYEEITAKNKLYGIVPIYKSNNNKLNTYVRKIIKNLIAKQYIDNIAQSYIPIELEQQYNLMSLNQAYQYVHFPENFGLLHQAQDRIMIEEYFKTVCAFRFVKKFNYLAQKKHKYIYTKDQLYNFIDTSFKYKLTQGQMQSIEDVYNDMVNENRIMNRLIQGDVGSGKTTVAICAIYIAIISKQQVAYIVPTEILAIQTFNKLKSIFTNYNICLIKGNLKQKERQQIIEQLKRGLIDVLIGTHAILNKQNEFANLSLCICDEQQRFGVQQRNILSSKGEQVDTLVMSATPIPRTLFLSFYGDLDISVINEKPSNRLPVKTFIVQNNKINDMYNYIINEAHKNNKTFIVCPRIDGEENVSRVYKNVNDVYDELKTLYPTEKIALLHGDLDNESKENIINQFVNNEVAILVSTTVIEIGVDIPDATNIIIYDADNYGLSQIHQLRGRVGRSDKQSYCFLLTQFSDDSIQMERLKFIKNTNDGFAISEYDLKMRGPGSIISEKQSGKMFYIFKNRSISLDLIKIVSSIVDDFYKYEYNFSKIEKIAKENIDKLDNIILN